MAIIITGSKYASAALSGVGTTTVTVTTTPFVSGDFSSTRLVGLWNAAGTTFKGMAWVRRYVSTSQLQLQTEFFHPITGATVTQVTGDTILVSKNFAESVQAGLTVTNKVVAITTATSITFGTAGTSNSICFYDENKEIQNAVSTIFAGGLSVFGKLEDFAAGIISSPCDWYLTGVTFTDGIRVSNAAANACFYGGTIDGNRANVYYVGANIGGGGGVGGNILLLQKVQNVFDFASPSAGGTWGANASNHVLRDCTSITTATFAIMVRWGDGVVSGGTYKFPNNTAAPLSVFGSDVAGTVAISAPSTERLILLDPGASAISGNFPQLCRSNTAAAITFNFTNLICSIFGFTQSTTGVANPNGVNNFYFSDAYTNLQSGSVGVITLDADSSTVDSSASTGTTWQPTVYRRKYTGLTQDFVRGPWTYGIKTYGYAPVSGAIAASNYMINGGYIADNVSFGGVVNQPVDSTITLTQAAANALSSIANLDEFYDASIAWSVFSVTNAQYPTLGTWLVTASGSTLALSSRSLTLDNAAVAAYAVNTGTHLITAKATNIAVGAKTNTITTTATITASLAAGGAYTYVNGSMLLPTNAPTLTGGTINIGAAATYGFSTSSATIVSMTPAAPSAYTFSGPYTGVLDLRNTSAHAITVTIPAGTTYTTAANVGGVITVQFPDVGIAVTGLVAGSTIQIYNTTDSVELYCAVVAGTSYTHSLQYVSNKALRLRVSKQSGVTAYTPFETIGTLTSSGASFTANQVASSVYNTWAIDGSAQTQYTADGPNIDIDITAGGSYTKKSLAAWWMYCLTSVAGIRAFWGAYSLESITSIRQDIAVIDVLLQNTATGTTVIFTDNDVRYYRSDFSIPYDTAPGYGSIFMDYSGVPLLPSDLAATTADAVWNSVTASYPTSGTFGLSVSQTKALASLIPAAL